MNIWTVLLAILIFSLMILMHEFGHFITARLFKVKVDEFALGMGPKILSYKGKKTVYSIRAFPIGGFCNMKGEDSDDADEDSFTAKAPWKRMLILVAGAFMNILFGILVMAVIVSSSSVMVTRTIGEFNEGAISNGENGLRINDEIVKVGTRNTLVYSDIYYFITKNGAEPIDITVIRDGKKTVVEDVTFATQDVDGRSTGVMDFKFYGEKKTFANVLYHSVAESFSNIRMIWDSFFDLFTGNYGIKDLSGPIGVTDAIGKAASVGIRSLLYMVSFISMNLGIANLLPIPALDGGRLVFTFIEMIRRKPIRKEIETYVNLGGLAVMLLLMIYVAVNDVIKIL